MLSEEEINNIKILTENEYIASISISDYDCLDISIKVKKTSNYYTINSFLFSSPSVEDHYMKLYLSIKKNECIYCTILDSIKYFHMKAFL